MLVRDAAFSVFTWAISKGRWITATVMNSIDEVSTGLMGYYIARAAISSNGIVPIAGEVLGGLGGMFIGKTVSGILAQKVEKWNTPGGLPVPETRQS